MWGWLGRIRASDLGISSMRPSNVMGRMVFLVCPGRFLFFRRKRRKRNCAVFCFFLKKKKERKRNCPFNFVVLSRKAKGGGGEEWEGVKREIDQKSRMLELLLWLLYYLTHSPFAPPKKKNKEKKMIDRDDLEMDGRERN